MTAPEGLVSAGGVPPMAAVTAQLTAPGAPFEMEEMVIRGIAERVWKNAPPTLRAIFEASAAHGDADFLVYEDERLTYAQHHRSVRRLAHELVTRWGVKKGDRVAIAMRNFPEWSVAFWAGACVGAIVVPVNAWLTGAELDYCISDCGADILFLDQERTLRLAEFLPALKLKAAIVARASGDLAPGLLRFEDVVDASPQDPPLPDVALEPEDDATIFYTSGTTGKPKGALGTHRNICTNLVSLGFCGARADLRRGVVPAALGGEAPPKGAMLLAVPFFHATGCHSVLVATLAAGNKIVLIHRWDAARALELIERERITAFGNVPTLVWQVLEHPDFKTRDTSSLLSVSYGGAPAAPELVARIKQAWPKSNPGQGYGLTETSSVTTINQADDYVRKPDSVGVPVPVCDVKVVGPTGETLGAGEIGEIWIKGPNVVKGYWNKPEATAATFTDNWLHSGDVGRIDEEGFVYILDRAKDMLIRGGENIYCVEVENVLFDHPAVMDAAVIGIPHLTLGEEVGAVVTLAPGQRLDEAALKAWMGERLAAFKVPVKVWFRDEPLPRNANGKILKRDLKKDLLDAA
ncbi:class I adenylate-forming enzyme family protein [Zavarzinia sp. CC-PAN008]|uniref:class I adenylate-forming enzyme family protein n=1 Tax=Zavarzinia sp. CC-PAN008 TaxID=3243332 RepID=UPI003F74A636